MQLIKEIIIVKLSRSNVQYLKRFFDNIYTLSIKIRLVKMYEIKNFIINAIEVTISPQCNNSFHCEIINIKDDNNKLETVCANNFIAI